MTDEKIVPLKEKTFFDADAYPGRERRVIWCDVVEAVEGLKKMDSDTLNRFANKKISLFRLIGELKQHKIDVFGKVKR
jgi:hypothetical protein